MMAGKGGFSKISEAFLDTIGRGTSGTLSTEGRMGVSRLEKASEAQEAAPDARVSDTKVAPSTEVLTEVSVEDSETAAGSKEKDFFLKVTFEEMKGESSSCRSNTWQSHWAPLLTR